MEGDIALSFTARSESGWHVMRSDFGANQSAMLLAFPLPNKILLTPQKISLFFSSHTQPQSNY